MPETSVHIFTTNLKIVKILKTNLHNQSEKRIVTYGQHFSKSTQVLRKSCFNIDSDGKTPAADKKETFEKREK